MTVIATVISRICTAHASDSLITRKRTGGKHEILDYETTKIVHVRHWVGAMAYWGLAVHEPHKWSTLDWLRQQANKANQFGSPEDFARFIGEQLNQSLSRMTFREEIEKGIGIHFTAYEWVDGYRIPELFAITNFESTEYKSLHPDGIRVTRETYNNVVEDNSPRSEHGKPQYRHVVRKHLDTNGLLLYNNGDPLMFNSAAASIFSMFKVAAQRNILKVPTSAKAHREIARWSIELVSRMQRDFVQDGYQMVGGKPHDLSVTPNGEYESDSGDN